MKTKILLLALCSSLLAPSSSLAVVPVLTQKQSVTGELLLPSKADPATPTELELWISTTDANTAKYRSGGTTYSLATSSQLSALSSVYQPLDADLTIYAGITPSANIQSLLGSADYAAARTNLGLAIGTDVQAYDADLTTWAGVTPGTGIATWLATPSSANLLAALTDETGTGAAVFATSPTLTTPILGAATATSITLTNGGAITDPGTGAVSIAAAGTNQSVTIAPTGTGDTVISNNPVYVTPSTGVNLSIVGADSGGDAGFMAQSFGTNANFFGRRANGTAASPTAIGAEQTMLFVGGLGYGETGYSAATKAAMLFRTSETWTDSAQGAYIQFQATPNGSTSRAEVWRMSDFGALISGTTAVSTPAWGVSGPFVQIRAKTITDSSSSGTVAAAVANSFGVPTFAASSATTFTNAANLYIAGGVAAGTNVTLTNSYGLLNDGKSKFVGQVQATAGLSLGTSTGSSTVNLIDSLTSTNNEARWKHRNQNSGAAAHVHLQISNNDDSGVDIRVNSSGFTTSGLNIQDGASILASAGLAGGLAIGTQASTPLVFAINNAEVSRFDGSTGALQLSNGLKVASTGTAADGIWSSTATLDFGSISAGASEDLTITVTGASTGDSVALGLPAAPEAGIVFLCAVTAANTVTVRAFNVTGSPIDPASATYRATVTSF